MQNHLKKPPKCKSPDTMLHCCIVGIRIENGDRLLDSVFHSKSRVILAAHW